MHRYRAVLAAAAGILLAALCASCAQSTPPIDGCSRGISQEAYQSGMYECPDGTLVFIFPGTDARDGWIATATQFAGTTVIDKGATWVKVREVG